VTARWLINLFLLIGLGLLVLVIHHTLTLTDRPATLATGAGVDLRRIEIERSGEPRIVLERDATGWRMREPLAVDADAGRIDQLIGLLDAPVYRSFPAQSVTLADLGLDPIKTTLRFDGLTLAFGGTDPIDQHRYVAADGLIHLIDDRYQHLLIAPPIDYYSRAILPQGPAPRFATLNGVPLAAKSLKALSTITAERVEPLAGDLSGEPLQFKFADGTALRFLVSQDRRRWDRPDFKLRYVLAEGMLLELDPGAVDPTPASPPRTSTPALPPAANLPAPDTAESFMPEPALAQPGDLPPGPPPEVRLSPDTQDPPENEGVGFGTEPGKETPSGFGIDPFAPDPARQ
jgi:hypothetical protein